MFGPLFVRVLWKEYRAQRAVWLAIIFFGLLSELLVYWFYLSGIGGHFGPFRYVNEALLATSRGVLILYVACASAILFGSEIEDRTLDSLRNWGIEFVPLVCGKLVFGILSSMVLAALVEILACWLSGQWELRSDFMNILDPSRTVQLAGLIAAGAIFLSQVTGNVLVAVVGALLVVTPIFALRSWPVLAVALVVADVGLLWYRLAVADAGRLWHRLAPRRLMLGLVKHARQRLHHTVERLAPRRLIPWLVMRVLPTDLPWRTRPRTVLMKDAGWPIERVSTELILRRLVWQESRHAVRVVLWLTAAALLAAVVVRGTMETSSKLHELIFLWSIVAAVFLPAFMFQGEHRLEQYRFLSERGVAPWTLWLSKHLLWGPLYIGFLFLIVCIGYSVPRYGGSPEPMPGEFLEALSAICGPLALAYATGQFFSFTIRRTMIAVMVLLVFDFVAYLWWQLVTEVLFIPGWLSMLPVVLILLAGSLAATYNRLDERGGWKGIVRLGLVLGLPFAVVLVGIATYRAYEIRWFIGDVPPVEAISPRMWDSPDGLETQRLYEQAFAVLITQRKQDLPIDASELELLHAATDRPDIALANLRYDVERNLSDKLKSLAPVLLHEGQTLQRAGKLEQALAEPLRVLKIARHCALSGGLDARQTAFRIEEEALAAITRWAVAAEQTPDRIVEALRGAERHFTAFPSPVESIRQEYALRKRAILRRPGLLAIARHWELGELLPLPLNYYAYCPWERRRAVDLLDRLAVDDLAKARTWREIVTRITAPKFALDRTESSSHYGLRDRGSRRELLLESTPTVADLRYLPYPQLDGVETVIRVRRSAFRLTLALCAWRLEHGELPAELGAPKAAYLKESPLDSEMDQQFEYEREGTVTVRDNTMPAPALVSRDKPWNLQARKFSLRFCWPCSKTYFGPVDALYYPIPTSDDSAKE